MLSKVISSALLFLILAQGAVAIPGPGPVVLPCGSPPNQIFCTVGLLCCANSNGGNRCQPPESTIVCVPPVTTPAAE
ncbi:hypothetical protein FB451DRAFT_1553993 [Mycena latifolia]|nr:hypothetical protein FB451DRAFT_1553993 [Mycena latifolia]